MHYVSLHSALELARISVLHALTIIAAEVESNVHIDSCTSLIRYATGIDSLLIAAKGAQAPHMDSARIMAESEEGVII
jgi:hypothetical protein